MRPNNWERRRHPETGAVHIVMREAKRTLCRRYRVDRNEWERTGLILGTCGVCAARLKAHQKLWPRKR